MQSDLVTKSVEPEDKAWFSIPRVRIAVPSFGLPRKETQNQRGNADVTQDELKSLFRRDLNPTESERLMTSSELDEVDLTRRLRGVILDMKKAG